jgi:septal ring factor EnvC (AmiA/AmiB activator)
LKASDANDVLHQRAGDERACVDPILRRIPRELAAEREAFPNEREIAAHQFAVLNQLKRKLESTIAQAQNESNPKKLRTYQARIATLTESLREQEAVFATLRTTFKSREQDLRDRINEAIINSVPPGHREAAKRLLSEQDEALAAHYAEGLASPDDTFGAVVKRYLGLKYQVVEAIRSGGKAALDLLMPEFEAEQARYIELSEQRNLGIMTIQSEYAAKFDSLSHCPDSV